MDSPFNLPRAAVESIRCRWRSLGHSKYSSIRKRFKAPFQRSQTLLGFRMIIGDASMYVSELLYQRCNINAATNFRSAPLQKGNKQPSIRVTLPSKQLVCWSFSWNLQKHTDSSLSKVSCWIFKATMNSKTAPKLPNLLKYHRPKLRLNEARIPPLSQESKEWVGWYCQSRAFLTFMCISDVFEISLRIVHPRLSWLTPGQDVLQSWSLYLLVGRVIYTCCLTGKYTDEIWRH